MRIERLSEIAASFDGMLIDQFGVIHDGSQLYPGSQDVLKNLHHLGIPVAVMTNSGKRAAANRNRLVRMGVPREFFVDVVSSGEIAYRSLDRRPAFVIGRRGDDYGLEGIPLVHSPQEAAVILILGSNAPETTLDDYRLMLAGLNVPALCCNPDKLMLTARGLQPGPGAIASLYEDVGGSVTWIGKPYPAIYAQAVKLLGDPHAVLCIGDSAEHDVAGASNAGLASLLIRTGVSEGADSFDPEPDYIADSFIW